MTTTELRLDKPKNYLQMSFPLLILAISLDLILGIVKKYLYSDISLVGILCLMITLDLFTGIVKSRKKGEVILSIGLRRTVTKITQYFAFLIVCHIVATGGILGDLIESQITWLPRVAGIYLVLIEMKSILENIYTDNKDVPVAGILNIIKRALGMNKLNKDNTNTNSN